MFYFQSLDGLVNFGLQTLTSTRNITKFVEICGSQSISKLPPPLRRVSSPATFKRQLQTFLYNHTFNSHC